VKVFHIPRVSYHHCIIHDSAFSYLGEAVLRQCDQRLFSGGTDVEPDRKQPLQGGNDKTRLHRVSIRLPLHLLPLLVGNDPLRQSNAHTQVKLKCVLCYSLHIKSGPQDPSDAVTLDPRVLTFDILHLVSVMRKDMLLISFWTTKFCSSLLKFCRKMTPLVTQQSHSASDAALASASLGCEYTEMVQGHISRPHIHEVIFSDGNVRQSGGWLAVKWIAIIFCTNIDDHERINPTDFG